ncbi:hypothetical protein DL767_000712 [Monosporascus sp. MG133]|nr:hypothetical protein DL767_000712 [Monosporascus sp. MG133]
MALKASVYLAIAFRWFLTAAGSGTAGNNSCSPSSFEFPEIFGITPINISAIPTFNYTGRSLPPGSSDLKSYTINFCNVTATYTHSGWNDKINVNAWLPLTSSWNGRLQALGGGGYSASFGPLYMIQAVANGYVALDTDAGHTKGEDQALSPKEWALTSRGNVNLYLVENWGYRSLHEMAVIGKTITKNYYKTAPEYSYFTGCSGGGRQALMIAERYAEDFDGMLAVAPAINIENFIPAGFWATQVMNDLGVYPPPCELDAFSQAAIDACDVLDGLKDGIISLPDRCHFDPHTVVGQNFDCNGTTRQYTEAGATIVQAAWTGPRSADGKIGWFGLNKDACLTSTYITTQCASNGTCSAQPNLLSGWIQYLLAKDPDWDATNLTKAGFLEFLERSERDYSAAMSAADPDLSKFRAAGGKMITWHGLADEAIPPNGTIAYYQQVLERDPYADEFFRFFEAPGVGHCTGGVGAAPEGAFSQLVTWVEDGVAPDRLTAVDSAGRKTSLCPFPLRQSYLGVNNTDAAASGCSLLADGGTPANQLLFY